MCEKLIKPTFQQVEWSDCEIGVIIHLDLVTFNAPYVCREHFGEHISPLKFAPDNLDTDQWLEAALKLGAKYAILVAKHCTGFSLWPTKAHDYSVANSPYKNGKGDIVAEFVSSCKKYGIRPGIYCSAAFNQYFNVENPGKVIDGDIEKQKQYNEIVLKQLSELWKNYGDWFEIWFDGGVLPVNQGGPDITSLLHELQPNAVVFQGPIGTRSLIRWVGNESGIAPENCSALYESKTMLDDGTVEHSDDVCKKEEIWCPAESDFPNRDSKRAYLGGWFWGADQDETVFSAEYLFERYISTVGRNSNMLVGMVIDTSGRFPSKDATEFEKAGEMIRKVFQSPLRSKKENCTILLNDTESGKVGYLAIGEDIAQGERIKKYTLKAYDCNSNEIFNYSGKVIGHKRIFELPMNTVKVDFEVTQSRAEPLIRFMELYPRLYT